MKRIFALIVLSSLFITFSASAFYVQGYAQFNRAQGFYSVCNQWASPIACAGNVFGNTRLGFQANGFINTILYPGQCISETVWAQDPFNDPLVNVWGQINCQWY